MEFARTRSAVNLLKGAGENFDIITALDPHTPVKILSRDGDWLQVQVISPSGLLNQIFGQRGFLPQASVVIVQPPEDVIPNLPGEVKARVVIDWLATTDKPPWISNQDWDRFLPDDQANIIVDIQSELNAHLADLNSWFQNMKDLGLENEVTIADWLKILQGGKDMWPLRAHFIYKEPDDDAERLVAVNVNEILKWNGEIQQDQNIPDRVWYRVNLFKFERENDGWFRGDLLNEYIHPTPQTDPSNPANAANIFDLTQPVLRIPDDPEIQDAVNDPAIKGAQYIMLTALGINRRHYNLCGELCVTALGGSNIIPFLQQWHGAYPPADQILRNNEPTGITDLQSMLQIFGLNNDLFRHGYDNIFSNSPIHMRDRLRNGELLIAGVGIKGNGELHANGTIRHWVVLEDVIPVANGGWYRIYNPFPNREEVYPFGVFKAALGSFGIGLWVEWP